MTHNSSWLSRCALTWERQPLPSESDTIGQVPVSPSPTINTSYWFDNNSSENSSCDEGNEICSVSYLDYLHSIMTISFKLREIIGSILSKGKPVTGNEHNFKRVYTIPIAVAIPEGPWLPISIAAVHALNQPILFSTTNVENIWISVALVPLDPSDGFDRLFHMLQDVHPAVIVTASTPDHDRLQQIVQQVELESHLIDSTELPKMQMFVGYTNTITVVNVKTLLTEAIESKVNERIRDILLESLNQDCMTSLQSIWNTIHCAFLRCDQGWVDNGIAGCDINDELRISHIVFTSGSTGRPKGCISSITSLLNYVTSKNSSHQICSESVVLLASAISFDPCMSDIIATLSVRGTLALAPRDRLNQNPGHVLRSLDITHVLCTPTFWSGVCDSFHYSKLRVVALGGEPIPRSLLRMWLNSIRHEHIKLFATYGVTEACVYQTIGEIKWEENPTMGGQDVGLSFNGINARVCIEKRQDQLIDVGTCGYPDGLGEIVLVGGQLDQLSSYLHLNSLSMKKFVNDSGMTSYRTGDRGYFHPDTNHLFIVGRIEGEQNTVKIKGIRVELGEIETSLVDDSNDYSVVMGAVAVAVQDSISAVTTDIHAYIVISKSCLLELGLQIPANGILCCDSVLLTLLRVRCQRRARVIPSAFIIIPRIPMSATGKRDRRLLPPLQNAIPITEILTWTNEDRMSLPLRTYGKTGSIIVEEITKCLNLQACQTRILSTTTTFAMLGGDSLTATRVVRALYARCHNVDDSRFIGGSYGVLDGPFSVRHLYNSKNLGEYVDWIDAQGFSGSNAELAFFANPVIKQYFDDRHELSFPMDGMALFEALLISASSRFTHVAMALLDNGADPNIQESEGRIGKISDRNTRKKIFRSNPLHLACLHGEPRLVKKLLEKGAKHNVPNASSIFPLHLAAGGEYHGISAENEDNYRLTCVQLLLDHGCNIKIRDGNKQTVLHAAARGGFVRTLKYAVEQWKIRTKDKMVLDIRDNWSRTPVHWAALHGHYHALEILLKNGFNANPPKRKESVRRTSVADESPQEMCTRLAENNPDIFVAIKELLNHYMVGQFN